MLRDEIKKLEGDREKNKKELTPVQKKAKAKVAKRKDDDKKKGIKRIRIPKKNKL
jgi:hypothetical protein